MSISRVRPVITTASLATALAAVLARRHRAHGAHRSDTAGLAGRPITRSAFAKNVDAYVAADVDPVVAAADRRVAAAALELLRLDADLDDDKFTPRPAIGLCVGPLARLRTHEAAPEDSSGDVS